MKNCAFLTLDERGEFVIDDERAIAPLADIGIVPTIWPDAVREGSFPAFFDQLDCNELVIKPVVGANGEFSHAILKIPAESEFRSQEERGANIQAVVPEKKLLLRGQQALSVISSPPLYARIDLVGDSEYDFVVMELELIEPSMYLRTDPDAPMRFARAIDQRYRNNV
jgi:hypothetical protein